MRAAIVKSEGYLDSIITRILHNNGIKGDFITKANRSTFLQYDVIVFTYQNKIPNISKVIEQISLEKKIQVIYISSTMSTGAFYNLLDDLYFNFIEEKNIEVALPSIVKISAKFIKEITLLKEELVTTLSELDLIKRTAKAKRLLIKKGLSEDESHKFIINKAMEMRITKTKLVNLIIENRIDIS